MVKLRPLKRRTDIETVWRQGKRVSAETIQLVLLCREEAGQEMGYVVSVPRRWVRKAVARSRLRRLLREALRQALQELEEGTFPFVRAAALVWRSPLGWEEVRRLRLRDVLPQVRELFRRACKERCNDARRAG